MPPFKNFTKKAHEAIKNAHELAVERGQNHVTPLHLLSALVIQEESMVASILDNLEIDLSNFIDTLLENIEGVEGAQVLSASYQMYLSPELAQVLENSTRVATSLKSDFVSTEHLFISLLDIPSNARQLLVRFGIEKPSVMKVVKELKQKKISDDQQPRKMKSIEKYTVNLTDKARNNEIDPVIGRDEEMGRLIQIVSRRTKNNPILIGEAGVGKTAIAEGLANRIASGDVPESLKDKELVSLDLGSLVAGTKFRGEFEDRMKGIMKDIAASEGKILLFIDEIHMIAGAGAAEGSLDASNMLKPALARGELKVIGATTLQEYQKHIEKDAALTRRFQPIVVEEPNLEDAIAIMRGIKEKYEVYHGVRITDDAVVAAVELSSRYITDRYLPDKAVDLIDEAASKLKISLENIPPQLEEARRRVMRLQIEKEALSNDKKSTKKAKRLKEIEIELADLDEEAAELELKWKNEKDTIILIKNKKEELEHLRHDADTAELNTDFSGAAEIRYGSIPKAQKELDDSIKRLKDLQKSRRILREDIGEEDIAEVVSRWTGVPVSRMLEEEMAKLARMEQELKTRLIGQDDAVERVASTVKRARAGISDPNKPIGSFMFLGPTGVGKTELTKALAEFMFDDEKSLIRVDMSEYMEKHSVSKLIGAPPGYIGHDEGGITERIRHRPYSVILFDEIEKAHPEVFNILLQVLDNGHLTDSKGRKINFKNAIIILTSNVGAEFIDKMESIGFSDQAPRSKQEQYDEMKRNVEKALKDQFRPEFLNRLDDVVIFDVLSKEAITEIVTIQIKDVTKRLEEKGINLKMNNTAMKYLAEEGYDPHYGARPLKRLIQNKILNPLAQLIISQGMPEGSTVTVGYNKKQFVFDVKKGRTKTSYLESDINERELTTAVK